MTAEKVFKSEESRDRIRSRYNQILSAFPYRQRYAETSYGKTFVLESGSPGNPELILLHGSCSNSAFWFMEMSALSPMFHVLAVDILGEAGNSDENRLDFGGDGYAGWLKEVMDAFSIKKAAVMGNSLGGWMALKFSVNYPEYVSKLVLVASSGLSGANTAFLKKAETASLQNEMDDMDPSLALGVELPKEVVEFIQLIVQGYYPVMKELPVFPDEQIKELQMPVLFIAGENDALIDAAGAAGRLQKLLPQAQVHLLQNTGHAVMNALTYAFPFLAGDEPPTGSA